MPCVSIWSGGGLIESTKQARCFKARDYRTMEQLTSGYLRFRFFWLLRLDPGIA